MIENNYIFIIGFSFAAALYGIILCLIYLIKKDNRVVANIETSGNKSHKLSGYIFKGVIVLSALAIVSILMVFVLDIVQNTSALILKARFKDVGMLNNGSRVIYRGVDVGKVIDISITPDSEYAIVTFIIPGDDFHLYEGSVVEIAFRSITGTQALVIKPPAVLSGKKHLVSGQVLAGVNSFTVDEMQKLIAKLVEEGKLEQMINDVSELVQNSNTLTRELVVMNQENKANFKYFLMSTSNLSASLRTTTDRFNTLMYDKKTINNLKNTISSTDTTLKNIGAVVNKTDSLIDRSANLMENLDESLTRFDETVNDPEIRSGLKQSLGEMHTVLTDINSLTGDKEVQDSLRKTLLESSTSLNNFNCVTKEMSNTLGKRFLVPRMIIGNPGKNLRTCFPE